MKVKAVEISEIRAIKIDSKKHTATLKVSFTEGGSLSKDVTLNEEYELMASQLVKWIKQTMKEQDTDDDEILGGISIVNIKNDEDVLDRAAKGFYRLDQRLDGVKNIRNATDYMKAYGQVLTMEEVIFKK